MTWTTQRPTAIGWYWYRHPNPGTPPEIVFVGPVSQSHMDGTRKPIETLTGSWVHWRCRHNAGLELDENKAHRGGPLLVSGSSHRARRDLRVQWGRMSIHQWPHLASGRIGRRMDRTAGASSIKWSTHKPTEPGWYWIGIATDEGIAKLIAHVWEENGTLFTQFLDGKILSIDEALFHFWAGPIPTPEGELLVDLPKRGRPH